MSRSQSQASQIQSSGVVGQTSQHSRGPLAEEGAQQQVLAVAGSAGEQVTEDAHTDAIAGSEANATGAEASAAGDAAPNAAPNKETGGEANAAANQAEPVALQPKETAEQSKSGINGASQTTTVETTTSDSVEQHEAPSASADADDQVEASKPVQESKVESEDKEEAKTAIGEQDDASEANP